MGTHAVLLAFREGNPPVAGSMARGVTAMVVTCEFLIQSFKVW